MSITIKPIPERRRPSLLERLRHASRNVRDGQKARASEEARRAREEARRYGRPGAAGGLLMLVGALLFMGGLVSGTPVESGGSGVGGWTVAALGAVVMGVGRLAGLLEQIFAMLDARLQIESEQDANTGGAGSREARKRTSV